VLEFIKNLFNKKEKSVRYIIRVTTYVNDTHPKYDRVRDDDGQTMLYSKGSAEDIAAEMAEAAKKSGLRATYEVIPDPNAEE
jgi:hypothetical protein